MKLELSEKAEAFCRTINRMEDTPFNDMLASYAEDLCIIIQFLELQPIAKEKGWQTPINDAFKKLSWVSYWKACIEAEEKKAAGDNDPGRPIAPHRSGRSDG